MPNLIQKCFDYYGQCAARIGPDPMCQIQLHTSNLFLFQRRPESCCAKLVLIWSGWPGQVLDKHTWTGSKLVCKNHRAQFWQNTNIWLPVSHFQTQLHSYTDGSDHIVQNQPGSDLVLADCQASAERSLSGSKPVGKNYWACFQADPEWMQIWSCMFTGKVSLPPNCSLMGSLDLLLQSQVAPDENSAVCLSPLYWHWGKQT